MKAFVTVGTTEFEELMKIIDTEDVLNHFQRIGINEIIIQYGHGKYIPQEKCGVKFTTYSTKPSIQDDMKAADLVITHAGAGSVKEALTHKKPTIVVINTILMDNHQTEMAEKLSELQAVTLCPSPQELSRILLNYTIERGKDVVLNDEENEKKINDLMSEWCELNDTNNKKTICVVLGSGGHTSEMLHCITPIDTYNNDYIKQFEFIIAESDAISSQRISRLQSKKNVHTIPRSRSVGQSYFTSIFTTLYALFVCFKMMYIIDADVLLCNGPGTCVPVCIACWVYNLLHLKKVKLIYLESVCRVTTLSLSGKILQHLVDVFVIQWEELKKLVKDAHVHHFFYSID